MPPAPLSGVDGHHPPRPQCEWLPMEVGNPEQEESDQVHEALEMFWTGVRSKREEEGSPGERLGWPSRRVRLWEFDTKQKHHQNGSWEVTQEIPGLLRILTDWIFNSICSEFLIAHWPPLKSVPTECTLGINHSLVVGKVLV